MKGIVDWKVCVRYRLVPYRPVNLLCLMCYRVKSLFLISSLFWDVTQRTLVADVSGQTVGS